MVTWSQMNVDIIQSADTVYSGHVLKVYEPGTTTAISIAIDENGGSPQATLTTNANGVFEVGGNEVIPFIDRDYKWALFANADDATNNSNPVVGFFDNVPTNETDLTTINANLARITYTSDYPNLTLAAAAAESGTLIVNDAQSISSDVVLKNVNLVFQNYQINGAGTLRGVLTNNHIPWGGIRVANNLELSKNRGDTVVSGDFYIDPCLGDDTNNGTSSTTPVKTLAQLKTLINTDIALANDNPIVCVLRGGRYEIESQIDFDTSQATASVTLKNNPNEKPVITGPLKWFFRSGNTATNDGTQFYNLFAADLNNKEIPISTTSASSDNRTLNRNQVQAVLNTSGDTLQITVDTDVQAIINASTNLAESLIYVTQSFTGSVYYGIDGLTGQLMTFTRDSSQTSNLYWNGFDTGVNQGFAPYVIKGLNGSVRENEWCNNGATVTLPNVGNVFFAPTQLQNPLLISANKYTFDGIELRYHMPTKANMLLNFFPSPDASAAFVSVTGNDFTFKRGAIDNMEGNGIMGTGDNLVVTDNTSTMVGNVPIGIGVDTDAENINGANISRNDFSYWGHTNAGGKCVWSASDTISVNSNRCHDGACQALWFQAENSGAHILDITCQKNVCWNLGMIDGQRHEQYMSNDVGGIYLNGVNSAVGVDMKCVENVVYNMAAFVDAHGIYWDNQPSGTTVTDNLVFRIAGNAFDCRDVSGVVDNNTTRRNIFVGGVKHQDNTTSIADKNAYMSSYGSTKGENLFSASVLSGTTDLDSGKQVEGTSDSSGMVHIQNLETLLAGGLTSADLPTISPYLTDMQVNRMGAQGTFVPNITGSSVAGAPTIVSGRQTGTWSTSARLIHIAFRIQYSAHSGSGNIVFDLSGIPYVARNLGNLLQSVYVQNLSASATYYGYISPNTMTLTLDPTVALPTGAGHFLMTATILFE
jgi:hypothetical protein